MLAASPAPDSTATAKPSFISFWTTSGTVATRLSPGNISFGIPIDCGMVLLLEVNIRTQWCANAGGSNQFSQGRRGFELRQCPREFDQFLDKGAARLQGFTRDQPIRRLGRSRLGRLRVPPRDEVWIFELWFA